MPKPRFLGILAAVVAIVASLGFSLLAKADDTSQQERLTLSPVSQRVAYDAGKSYSGKFTIINDGQTSYDFVVYARPYSVSDENYNPNFSKVTQRSDLYQWVQFAQTTYHLSAGARVDVPYAINVPQTAAPGGHYGVLFAETVPPQNSTGAVIRKKRVGMIMYATINGQTIQQGKVLSTDMPFWQRPPLDVTQRIQNTGNTDFTATSTMTASDVFGRVKYQTSRDFALLPDTIRKTDNSWSDAPWFGLYKVNLRTVILGKTTEVSSYVLLMPRWLPIAVGIVIVGGVLYVAVRRYLARRR